MNAAVVLLSLVTAASGRPSISTDNLEKAIQSALVEMDLSTHRKAAVGESLAVGVRVRDGARRAELRRLVLGLTRARAERHEPPGAEPILLVRPGDDATLGDFDRAARARGAEWLLLVTIEQLAARTLEIRAELRAVDRGLWAPVPDPDTTAIAAFSARSLAVTPGLAALVNPKPTGFSAGAPRHLLRVRDTIVAMTACELDGRPDSSELVVLGTRRLFVFKAEDERLVPIARHDLSRLPRAKVRSRDPIGGLACANLHGDRRNEISFGHSGLLTSHVATLEKGKSLRIIRTMNAVPLAAVGKNRVVFGHVVPGRNVWGPKVEVGGADKRKFFDLTEPFFELVADVEGAENRRLAAVSDRYELIRYDDRFAPKVVGTSGVGIAFAPRGSGRNVLVATSSRTAAGDEIRFGSIKAASKVEVSGPVHVSTVWRLRRGGPSSLIVATRKLGLSSGGSTDLSEIQIAFGKKATPLTTRRTP